MNTNIDKQIILLFWKLIKSWDKISNIDNGEIVFENGISLRAFKKNSKETTKENKVLALDECTFSQKWTYWTRDIVIPDSDKLIFYINTPYRQYIVPEITDRHDYAEVLNTIDNSLRKFEEKKLSEYLDYFDEEL